MADGGSVRPAIALAFAVVGFVALTIAGLGLLSLARDEDIIVVAGVGQLPGGLAVVLALAAFAGAAWLGVRSSSPSYSTALIAAAAAFLAYIVGVGFGVLLVRGDVGPALASAARVTVGGYALVVGGAAFVAGLGAIALVRARGGRPRWPWERR